MPQPQNQKLWGIVLAGKEDSPVRDFLIQLCGGTGIKQFCAVIGRRSLLEHTLARVEQLIPRQRILVVVNAHHHEEANQCLASWPTQNILCEPFYRGAPAEVLLALAHLIRCEPFATVAIFPADHFILDEGQFVACVQQAVTETQAYQYGMPVLGVQPDPDEKHSDWIEPGRREEGRLTRAVKHWWRHPSPVQAHALTARGALWNTEVYVAQAAALWEMVRQAVPDLYYTFSNIRTVQQSTHRTLCTEYAYETMTEAVNFSSDICQPLRARLRLLPLPDVGWSDWESEERILASAQQVGKREEILARLRRRSGEMRGPLPVSETPQMRRGIKIPGTIKNPSA